MSRIFWDTNLYICLFERHPAHWQALARQRDQMLDRGDELITSAIALGEVQVLARRIGDLATACGLRDLIKQSSVVIPLDSRVADFYADIRAITSIRGADAVQLACASAYGVDLFITNDKQLQKLPKLSGIASIFAAGEGSALVSSRCKPSDRLPPTFHLV